MIIKDPAVYPRRKSRRVMVGNVPVGDGAPISVQSMTKTPTADTRATIAQIRRLTSLGCDIIRVAVLDKTDAGALADIIRESPVPVIADIHFDHKLALIAINAGVHGLRINPGNIGAKWKVRELVSAARERALPIRIGVNGGSLEADLLEKHAGPKAGALVESAMRHIGILEDLGYREIKLALKASSVPVTLEAYRTIAAMTEYPLHVGITETGLPSRGIIVSAVGIGALLAEGIGDTIRVSLTDDPEAEVVTARRILAALGLAVEGARVIACPTCGRTQVDLRHMAEEVEKRLSALPLPADRDITVAVMGCPVNGPGEAKDADFGIACGKGSGLLFAGGKQLGKYPEDELIDALIGLISDSVK